MTANDNKEEHNGSSVKISSVGQRLNDDTTTRKKIPQESSLAFDVTDQDCDKMMNALSQEENAPWKDELKYVSRAWVKAVMSQPMIRNKKMRPRPFEYAKKKLVDYLDWRYKHNITEEIEHYLSLEDGKEFTKVHLTGGHCMYWYGVDKDGCPNLWYRAEMTDFDKVEVKKSSKSIALIMQAAIDKMPADTYNFNVIAFFDEFNFFKAMKKPSLIPNFVKTLMKVSPDRLKSACIITSRGGGVLYDIAKKVAPATLMNKTTKCKSREEAADLLQRNGVLCSDEIPDFMGGEYIQDKDIVQNYAQMMKEIEKGMHANDSSITDGDSDSSITDGDTKFICKGKF